MKSASLHVRSESGVALKIFIALVLNFLMCDWRDLLYLSSGSKKRFIDRCLSYSLKNDVAVLLMEVDCSSSSIFSPRGSITWMPCAFCKWASMSAFFRNHLPSFLHESPTIQVRHLIPVESLPHLKRDIGSTTTMVSHLH